MHPVEEWVSEVDSGKSISRKGDGRAMARPMNQEELEFVKAIEDFKKSSDKLFLSWTEVLSIVKDLGYTRTVKARPVTDSKSGNRKSKASKTSKSASKSTSKAKKSA